MITGTIKKVFQDEVRGSIVVETEYKNGDTVIQTGHTRYLETSGTNEEIIAKVKEDVKEHCDNLVKRIPANKEFSIAEKLKIQKALTLPVIDSIKGSLIDHEESSEKVSDEFKGKIIEVTVDGNNTVKDK